MLGCVQQCRRAYTQLPAKGEYASPQDPTRVGGWKVPCGLSCCPTYLIRQLPNNPEINLRRIYVGNSRRVRSDQSLHKRPTTGSSYHSLHKCQKPIPYILCRDCSVGRKQRWLSSFLINRGGSSRGPRRNAVGRHLGPFRRLRPAERWREPREAKGKSKARRLPSLRAVCGSRGDGRLRDAGVHPVRGQLARPGRFLAAQARAGKLGEGRTRWSPRMQGPHATHASPLALPLATRGLRLERLATPPPPRTGWRLGFM